MKTRGFIGFLFAITASANVFAAGTSSANFLKLGLNPRAIAMGEAQVGLADDVYASYWNPAGLANLQNPEAGFVHAELLENIQSETLAYAHPTAAGTFGGHLTHLHMGAWDAFDAGGERHGTVDASDTAVAFSYARPFWANRRMSSNVALGASGKFIHEQLDSSSAQALAMDSGLLYTPGQSWGKSFEGFKAGCVVRNLGSRLRFDQESFPLPQIVVGGLSWTGLWLGEMLTLTADIEKGNDHPASWGTGAELSTLRLLILRAGYSTKSDVGNGLRLGFGLRFKTLQLDYAYANAADFGLLHRVGITFRFGIAPPDPVVLAQSAYDRGLHAMRRSRHTEALVHFNQALELDPQHPDALKKMKETYEKLKTPPPL